MRRFNLYRHTDPKGFTGVGVLAQGVEFDNGKCALSWLPSAVMKQVEGETSKTSVSLYDDASVIMAVHNYNGDTEIQWIDEVLG